MKALVILQHGWAMDGSVFSKWKPALDGLALQMRDSNQGELEYFVAERGYFHIANDVCLKALPTLDKKIMVIAHSLGLHLIPAIVRESADFLLSLSSFANFHQDAQVGCRLSKRRLERMITKLKAEPLTALRDFWAACDWPVEARPAISEDSINLARLVSDLELLHQVDIQPGWWPHKANICVLQGNNDPIVSIEQARTLGRVLNTEGILEVDGANHLAPVFNPDPGVLQVIRFLQSIA